MANVRITLKPTGTISLARKEDYEALAQHAGIVFEYSYQNKISYFIRYDGVWFSWG